MALFVRIYYNAVFGALGGLAGWMLFGVFGDRRAADAAQPLLGGALIGGLVGYFVVSVEAIRDRSLIRFCRLASYGVVLGSLGGALGMWVAEGVNYALVRKLIDWFGSGQDGATGWRQVGEVASRGVGWLVLGLTVGVCEGVAARSLGKLSYGAAGGALGGLLGGVLYGLLKMSEKAAGTDSHVWGEALGLVILGACIGALSALVQGVFQPASLRVLRGWQEGREYPLLKGENTLGRDERVDVPLFRDMKVEKRHAVVKRSGDGYVLVNQGAPADQTRVNDSPVSQSQALRDGDRIQLGNVLLRFQRHTPAKG